MNLSNTTDRSLSIDQLHTALSDIGGAARPDYLSDIVAQAGRTRQRPGWTFPERWLATDIAVRADGMPRTAVLSATLLLLALLAAAGVYLGSQMTSRQAVVVPQPSAIPAASPNPTGSITPPASPDLGIFEPVAGRILSGGWNVDPEAFDPDAPSDTRRLRLGPEPVLPLGWSRDGTKLLLLRPDPTKQSFPYDSPHLFTLHADGSETRVAEEPVERAAVSPDGSQVVFVPEGGGLYVVDAEGGAPVRIAETGSSPTFSPDGTQIAYLVDGDAGPGGTHVWVADVDGTDAHEILAGEPALAEGVFELTWSPGGDRIAIGNSLENHLAIYTFAPDGSGFKWINDGVRPFWSPDGSQIVYMWPYDGPVRFEHVAIADADGSNARTFDFGGSGPWHPVVPAIDEPVPSPNATVPPASSITRLDGEVLRFSGEQSRGAGDLLAVDPETGQARVLVEDVPSINAARWSADGRWIAYDHGMNQVELWVVGSDRPPRQVVARGDEWAWSPEGAQLAVVDESGVAIFDASTGGMTRLAGGVGAWSPDGTRLVSGERGGSIYSLDVRTGERSLLVRLPGDDLDSVDRIEWSPDGSRLAIYNDLVPGLGRLFVMNADGSDIRVLAEDAFVSGLDWSPEGRRIAFTESSDAELRMWVAPADGSTKSLRGSQPNPDDDGGDPVWSPDGSQIGFWTEPDTALVIDADGSGGVAPLAALTYEKWRGGWFACRPCAGFASRDF